MRQPPLLPTKPCPLCGEQLPLGATRCGSCEGDLLPGRTEAEARQGRHARRYRLCMRTTAAVLAGLGLLGMAAVLLGRTEDLVGTIVFCWILLLLAAGASTLRRWINHILLVFWLPASTLYLYPALKFGEPGAVVAASAGTVLCCLAFLNLHAYRRSVLDGVDPRGGKRR